MQTELLMLLVMIGTVFAICIMIRPKLTACFVKAAPAGAVSALLSFLLLQDIFYTGFAFMLIDIGYALILYRKSKRESEKMEGIKKHNDELENNIRSALSIIEKNMRQIEEADLSLLDHEKILYSRIIEVYEECLEAMEMRDPGYDFRNSIAYMDKNLEKIYNAAVKRHDEYYRARFEEYQREEKKREEQAVQKNKTPSFFAGCDTADTIKKRYKALCKVYHPDNGSGDAESFAMITSEYERLLKQVAR